MSTAELPHRGSEILGVQTASALCAGCTSATLTNPLDVIKTRLQVSFAGFAIEGQLSCRLIQAQYVGTTVTRWKTRSRGVPPFVSDVEGSMPAVLTALELSMFAAYIYADHWQNVVSRYAECRGHCKLSYGGMPLQVSQRASTGQRATVSATVRQLWREQGVKGFTRGLTPRIANAAM